MSAMHNVCTNCKKPSAQLMDYGMWLQLIEKRVISENHLIATSLHQNNLYAICILLGKLNSQIGVGAGGYGATRLLQCLRQIKTIRGCLPWIAFKAGSWAGTLPKNMRNVSFFNPTSVEPEAYKFN